MSAVDLALLAGQLLSCWCLGFGAGFTLTRFKEAINHSV